MFRPGSDGFLPSASTLPPSCLPGAAGSPASAVSGTDSPRFQDSDNFFLYPSPQLGRAAKAAGSALNQGVQNVAENLEGALVTFGEGQAERAGYALLLMLSLPCSFNDTNSKHSLCEF